MSIKCCDELSRGRLYEEKEDKYRTCFQRDRDRIIHSAAFRKLEYKTQVFINHEGDYYRTRLTHSLEVAQITRSICNRLQINETLGEAIALAHDFGHTPFGHTGEEALQECTAHCGGFDHNAQSIRVLTFLEQRYASFDGMNLTWEVLEGVAKHNGPIEVNDQHKIVSDYNKLHDLELNKFSCLEAQVASIADDIAYIAHDIDDGIRSQLITLKDLENLPYIGEILHGISVNNHNLCVSRLIHECSSRLISGMINDVANNVQIRCRELQAEDVQDVRNAEVQIVCFSDKFQNIKNDLKSFLFKNLYRNYKVNRVKRKAKQIVKDLFECFSEQPECLPTDWQKKICHGNKILVICDFIAGMTDRFAMQWHKQFIAH